MKGLVIAVGGPPKGGSTVEKQERENAMRAFMDSVQNGDVQAALKAYGRLCEAGPPPMDAPADEGADEGASDNAPKGGKTSMYRDEEG